MIAAAFLAAAFVLPTLPATSAGDWVVVTVVRVIAPDQHPGECFVQARVEQVVRGRVWSVGQPIGLSLACRRDGVAQPIALDETPAVQTIRSLRAQKRALVNVDTGGRVLMNRFYGLDPAGTES